jgi:hypothetical protein
MVWVPSFHVELSNATAPGPAICEVGLELFDDSINVVLQNHEDQMTHDKQVLP